MYIIQTHTVKEVYSKLPIQLHIQKSLHVAYMYIILPCL